ncbi:unnamed protein product [Lota lota]
MVTARSSFVKPNASCQLSSTSAGDSERHRCAAGERSVPQYSASAFQSIFFSSVLKGPPDGPCASRKHKAKLEKQQQQEECRAVKPESPQHGGGEVQMEELGCALQHPEVSAGLKAFRAERLKRLQA